MIVGVLAALAVVVSLVLPWRTGGVHPSGIPAAFLWDRGTSASDPSLLVFLVPLAVVLSLGALLWGGDVVRVFAGLGVLVVCGVFAYQLDRAANSVGAHLGDLLDSGFYVATIGGFLAWVSAMLPQTWGVRHDVVEQESTADAVVAEPRPVAYDDQATQRVATVEPAPRGLGRRRAGTFDE